MKKLILIIPFLLILTGCFSLPDYSNTTPEPEINSFIMEQQKELEENYKASLIPTEFKENTEEELVSYTITGNAKKFQSDAENEQLYYSAQVGWQNGFKYFAIADKETRFDIMDSIGSYYQTRATVYYFNNEDNEFINKNFESYYIVQAIFSEEDAKELNNKAYIEFLDLSNKLHQYIY